jgi:hypothetical protein
LRQRAFVGAQVIAQNAFHYGTQICGGLEVAALIERSVCNAWPIGDYAPALEGAASTFRTRSLRFDSTSAK